MPLTGILLRSVSNCINKNLKTNKQMMQFMDYHRFFNKRKFAVLKNSFRGTFNDRQIQTVQRESS